MNLNITEANNKIYAMYVSINIKRLDEGMLRLYKEAVSTDGINFELTGDEFDAQYKSDYMYYTYEDNILMFIKNYCYYKKEGGNYIQSRPIQSKYVGASDIRYWNGNDPISYKEDFYWTDREFIIIQNGEYYKSTNMNNWQLIKINKELAQKIDRIFRPEIVWAGEIYIIRNTYHDASYWGIYDIKQYGAEKLKNQPFYILDEGFNLVSEQVFNEPITDFSYVDDKYYIRTQDYITNFYTADPDKTNPINTIYVSDDAVHWTVDQSLTEVPLTNGGTNILTFKGNIMDRNLYKEDSYGINSVAITNHSENRTKVKFEAELLPKVEVIDGIYLSYEKYTKNKPFKISNDGVYWYELNLPNDNFQISNVIRLSNDIAIVGYGWEIRYNLNKLHSILSTEALNKSIYVKLNNEILGFETSPVVENDRTLVPLRFTFESMGADVQWDDSTKSATVIRDEKKVSFTIDNTNAMVEGKIKSMDVPARLINGKTMIPLRFISEKLGYEVSWDESTQTASIKTK